MRTSSFWVKAVVITVLALFFGLTGGKWVNRMGQPTIFNYDVDQYYSYLPATFIHKDLTFNFEHGYWTQKLANGNQVPKVTMGMAILLGPGFAAGHLLASQNPEYNELTGYEPEYDRCVHYGTLFYALVAAFFMLKNLMYFYKPWVAGFTYLVAFFGSNLFYYTLFQGEVAHSYLFMLLAIFVWATLKVHEKPKVRWLLVLGFTLGLATLIRPTMLLVILFPLLYKVHNKSTFLAKWQFIKSLKWRWLIIVAAAALPILPQLFYWQWLTGQWLFYSYGSSEGFFWADPKILQILFSYRAGWLVYTPLALFMLMGFWFLAKQQKSLLWATAPLLGLSIYVISAWWDWWYGGHFGHRAFVHYYAFWIFPLGAFFTWLFRQRFLKFIGIALVAGFIFLNVLQSRQYFYSILHYDSMSKEAYWYVFGKTTLTKSQYQAQTELLVKPNYEAARKGQRDQ